jgi:hypothetical protein
MKRTFTFSAALIFFVLMLALSTSSTVRTVKASDLQEKCDDCTIRNARQFDQCLATHPPSEQLRCYDQYNEGVVICFRNFCEQ